MPAVSTNCVESNLLGGLGVVVVALLVSLKKFEEEFFQFIEKRNGIYLNDPLLDILPATDLSVPVFAIIWCTTILTLVRAVQNPRIFIIFLFGFSESEQFVNRWCS